jgi:DNA polymerase III epsilon subunit family exonuclease
MNPLLDSLYEEYFERYPHERRIAAFDVETTGFRSSDRLTEIGIAGYEFDGYKIKYIEFETFIDPERSIPEEIVNLTHITDEMVLNAPKDIDIYPKFIEFIEGSTRLVAHNSQFDHRMVTSNFNRVGLNIPNFEDKVNIHCTLRRAKKSGLIVPKYDLASLCEHFGYTNENAHRAKDDALATLFVWGKLALQS